MIITTTSTIQDRQITNYLDVVTAEVIYGTNALRDFMAGIRDMFGGRTGSYEQIFEKAQLEAIAELKQRARKLGADGIIGISVDTGTINVDQDGVLILVTAIGTAVKLS
jgi:uncharacterized protein YbjQ (UPF0145 family)